MKYKLGRLPKLYVPNACKFENYLKPGALVVPQRANYSLLVPKNTGAMLNDQLGDCTCAGIGHAAQVWTANHGKMVTPTDADVGHLYEQAAGYDPSQDGPNGNPTDQGAALQTIVQYVQKHGFSGMKLEGAVEVPMHNLKYVRAALYYFGGIYCGMQVPANLPEEPGKKWHDTTCDDIEGGHCVYVCDYNIVDGTFTLISWGMKFVMTEAFFRKYFDEVIGLVSTYWVSKSLVAPNKLDLTAMLADMKNVGQAV